METLPSLHSDTDSTNDSTSDSSIDAGYFRRFAAGVYEIFFITSIVFVFVLFAELVTKFIFAIKFKILTYNLLVFVILGGYFVYSWIKSGQSLGMRIWRIKLVHQSGQVIAIWQTVARYCLCWMWVLPAATLNYLIKPDLDIVVVNYLINVIFWGSSVAFTQSRQFAHDVILKTKIIEVSDTEMAAKKTMRDAQKAVKDAKRATTLADKEAAQANTVQVKTAQQAAAPIKTEDAGG